MIQYGVAALAKDMPNQVVFCTIPTGKHENRATTDCASSWIIRVALNSSNLPCWTTSQKVPKHDISRENSHGVNKLAGIMQCVKSMEDGQRRSLSALAASSRSILASGSLDFD